MPPIYKDPAQPIEARVDDLLSRMTVEEKIGQMCQLDGRNEPEMWITEKHVGSFLHIIGQRTNELQKVAEQTRLGIPLIFGIDAIHGHAFWPEATVFPTQLGSRYNALADKKPIAFRQLLGLIFEPNSLQVKTERYKGKEWTGELVSYRLNEKIQRKKDIQSFGTFK